MNSYAFNFYVFHICKWIGPEQNVIFCYLIWQWILLWWESDCRCKECYKVYYFRITNKFSLEISQFNSLKQLVVTWSIMFGNSWGIHKSEDSSLQNKDTLLKICIAWDFTSICNRWQKLVSVHKSTKWGFPKLIRRGHAKNP